MKTQTLILLATLLSAACSTSQTTLAYQPSLKDYQTGESWTWKYKGMTSDGTVRAQGTDTKKIINKHGALTMVSESINTPLAQIVKPNASNTPRYDWPLAVGKTWIFEESWTSEDGTSGKTTQIAQVLSYQAETVEAGTFMAYKIKYTGTISNSTGYSAPTGDVHWYAPKVKAFIKLTQTQDGYSYTEELSHYAEH